MRKCYVIRLTMTLTMFIFGNKGVIESVYLNPLMESGNLSVFQTLNQSTGMILWQFLTQTYHLNAHPPMVNRRGLPFIPTPKNRGYMHKQRKRGWNKNTGRHARGAEGEGPEEQQKRYLSRRRARTLWKIFQMFWTCLTEYLLMEKCPYFPKDFLFSKTL